MQNGTGTYPNGYGSPRSPHIAVDVPPDEQTSDRDVHTWNGGLASQDVNAQYYDPGAQGDADLTYSEGQSYQGRSYQHSDSFADHAPHTLVG